MTSSHIAAFLLGAITHALIMGYFIARDTRRKLREIRRRMDYELALSTDRPSWRWRV